MGGGELLPTLTGAFEGTRAREEPIVIYLLKKSVWLLCGEMMVSAQVVTVGQGRGGGRLSTESLSARVEPRPLSASEPPFSRPSGPPLTVPRDRKCQGVGRPGLDLQVWVSISSTLIWHHRSYATAPASSPCRRPLDSITWIF